MFQKIIVAVDLTFKDNNLKTLRAGAAIAKANQGELRLVYVRYMLDVAAAYIPAETLKADEEDSLEGLRDLAKGVDLPSERVSVVSPVGRAYAEILAVASEFGADLIVIGPHSPSMAKFLLGSDAHRIVQHAPMSVLVVR